MSDNTRRPHIGLKPRTYKKTPYVPSKDEEQEGEEKEFIGSDYEALQSITNSILNNKTEREEKHNIRFESDLYFIVKLFDKVLWRTSYDKIQTLPIKITEILGEKTIKVKLDRDDYDEFYYALEGLSEFIENIRQIDIGDKINPYLFEEINDKIDESGNYTIELSDLSKTDSYIEYEANFLDHIRQINSTIIKVYESEYDVLYSLFIENRELVKLTETLDSITRVEKEPETYLNYDSSELNFLETDLVENRPTQDFETICIIDSGINHAHQKFNGIISDTFDFSTNNNLPCNDTIPHGSCVASFAAYGEDPRTTQNPTANILMVKNYLNRTTRILDNILAIQRTLNLYGEGFKVLNLSYGSQGPNLSYSKTLDRISYRNSLITITSAGNIPIPTIESRLRQGDTYPDYLLNYPIYFPGDCRNIITVGGCTQIASNLAPIDAPSPFTKTNSSTMLVKPDVVDVAGNLAVRGNPQGISTQGLGLLSASNVQSNYIEKRGTSFSAPIVSNHIAQLINGLRISNPALLKALLLSCSHFLLQPNRHPYDTAMQGFGKPIIDEALFSQTWKCNYLLEGEFNSRNPWNRDRYNIWFPAGADTLEVTLVCEKSETLYPQEAFDNVRFRVHNRAGTAGNTRLRTILGNSRCFNSYKGEYHVQRGSRGLWQIEIVPQFSTRYYMNLNMRYGCVISVKDSNKTNNVWDPIYDDWLEPIVGEYTRSEEEQSIGLLTPRVIEVDEMVNPNQ